MNFVADSYKYIRFGLRAFMTFTGPIMYQCRSSRMSPDRVPIPLGDAYCPDDPYVWPSSPYPIAGLSGALQRIFAGSAPRSQIPARDPSHGPSRRHAQAFSAHAPSPTFFSFCATSSWCSPHTIHSRIVSFRIIAIPLLLAIYVFSYMRLFPFF